MVLYNNHANWVQKILEKKGKISYLKQLVKSRFSSKSNEGFLSSKDETTSFVLFKAQTGLSKSPNKVSNVIKGTLSFALYLVWLAYHQFWATVRQTHCGHTIYFRKRQEVGRRAWNWRGASKEPLKKNGKWKNTKSGTKVRFLHNITSTYIFPYYWQSDNL